MPFNAFSTCKWTGITQLRAGAHAESGKPGQCAVLAAVNAYAPAWRPPLATAFRLANRQQPFQQLSIWSYRVPQFIPAMLPREDGTRYDQIEAVETAAVDLRGGKAVLAGRQAGAIGVHRREHGGIVPFPRFRVSPGTYCVMPSTCTLRRR